MATLIKICGLTRPQDVELALDLGADRLGFVHDPASPRFVKDFSELREAMSRAGREKCVAVYGEFLPGTPTPDCGWVQAFNPLAAGNAFRKIRTLRPSPEFDPSCLEDERDGCDWALVDGWHANKAGGAGIPVEDSFFVMVRERAGVPVALAGGLKPGTVQDVVERLAPDMVDVSSGVESSPGVKDEDKMRAFFEAVRSA